MIVTYELEDSVARIAMDDGKVNALSPHMLTELGAALDRAEADGAGVVLAGREGIFSAGFDLTVLRAGGGDAAAMVRGGFELAARLLAFPAPVTIACTGHAIAMASFLLLSADYRVGAAGAFRINANEVALGITMPRAAIAICRERLNPGYFTRTVVLAEPFAPDAAVDAGFLDTVVEPAAVRGTAWDAAVALSKLDQRAHAATKLRSRAPTLDAIRAGIEADADAFQ